MTPCFSWEGEDILARRITKDVLGVERGCYVDVGAHHPLNLSNTHLLHSLGWRGINIDAAPGAMELFKEYRGEDVNLEVAVAEEEGRRVFTVFEDPALNGFVEAGTVHWHEMRGIKVVSQVEIDCFRLDTILERHAQGRSIDLMSIDVEGLDVQVLKTMDIERWRPKLIIVEVTSQQDLAGVQHSPAHAFLSQHDYVFYSRLHYSCFFLDRRLLTKRATLERGLRRRVRSILESLSLR